MPRFLVELPHDAEERACARYVKVILQSGSHFLVQAEWGCMDGEHSAWIIFEAGSKDEARSIVPPALRARAKIVALNSFTLEQMEAITGPDPQ